MAFEIYPTTAEDIIGATDATLQNTDADENLVAQFLDVPIASAKNALMMAGQLGLIKKRGANWVPALPYAIYLVTSVRQYKSAILRLVLEQYPPYKYFKNRLVLNGIPQEAANQTRAVHNLTAHRNDILGVFVSLGTYTNSLASEGGGLYKVPEGEANDYLLLVQDVIQDRELSEQHIRKRLGQQAADWVDQREVLDHLVTAYQRLSTVDDEARAPIVHAANAVESFLLQVGGHYAVGMHGANGINAKADRLAAAHHLTGKHKNMVKYLGHVRNAAEHGADAEIGQVWEITPNTSVEYVHVAQSVVRNLVAYVNNQFSI